MNSLYPVGSIFTTIQNSDICPLNFGTWEKIASGKCLFGADSTHTPGSSIEAGLPNITNASISFTGLKTDTDGAHTHTCNGRHNDGGEGNVATTNYTGLSCTIDSTGSQHSHNISGTGAKMSISNQGIFNGASTVQPPAVAVIFWKRTA